MPKSEQKRQLEAIQYQLERATRLEALQQLQEYSIIDDTLTEVLQELANDILNGKPLEPDEYKTKRDQIDGVRLIQNRLETIKSNGNRARESLDKSK